MNIQQPDQIDVCGIILPNKPLSNYEIEDAVQKLKLKHFRGVFCSDELPKKPRKIECGILNLDDSDSNGTHWCCYYKLGESKIYFDSYGLHPPSELNDYLGDVYYNTEQIQQGPTVFCGHLCLYVLKKLQASVSLFQDFQKLNTLY
jgi:hypothetical protein